MKRARRSSRSGASREPKLSDAPHDRQFGEQGRRLSYGSYLKVGDILASQSPLADPPAHDELLFIVIHQVYELWFKQLLFELDSIRERMFDGDIAGARHLLARVHTVERVMIEQVNVLESMSPQDFMKFREHLAPASGFQSVQFREVEFVSGIKDARYIERLELTPEELARLRRRLEEPTLWDAFCSLLAGRGLSMPADDEEVRRDSLVEMARNRSEYPDPWHLSEELLTHDELIALWRHRHVLMVERQIGTKSGTGGSAGAPYLRTTLAKRFFPELWDLRSYL